ncbi:MAG: hypothetical protein IJN42_00105 [Clostridia bacterium]|nr:hypothetical protein [Clostridia bacterium]
MEEARGILSALESMLGYFEWFSDFLEGLKQSIDNLASLGFNLAVVTHDLKGLVTTLFWGGGAIALLVTSIFLLIFAIVSYVLCSIPVYRVAKKLGKKTAWFAWVPFARKFALCDIAGDKPLPVFGKKKPFTNRMKGYLILFLINTFCPVAEMIVLIVVPTVLPFMIADIILTWLGLLLFVSLPLFIILARCHYLMLKDVLDLYSTNEKRNATTALIAVIFDEFILPVDLAQSIMLFGLRKKDPIAQPIEAEWYS